jgi:hypothetical protein
MENLLGNQQPNSQMKIDINQSTAITCADCGYDTFVPGMKFRKISRILTGTASDAIVPIDIFLCGQCGAVCTDLLPNEIRNLS